MGSSEKDTSAEPIKSRATHDERKNRKQKRPPEQVAATLHVNEYLKCEGQNRLVLRLLASCDIGCDIGFLPSLEDFWARLTWFVNDRLSFFRMSGSAVRELKSTEVKQIVNDSVKHGWLVLTDDGRGFTISVTPSGDLARRGDPPEPTIILGESAIKIVLRLLQRAHREKQGKLRDDPRLFRAGIAHSALQTWAMHRGLSEDAFVRAYAAIKAKQWAIESWPRPELLVVQITVDGENELDAGSRVKGEVADDRIYQAGQVESSDKKDQHGPYFPSDAFLSYVTSSRLAHASRDGLIQRKKVGKRWHYSWPDAQKNWPQLIPKDHPEPKPSL